MSIAAKCTCGYSINGLCKACNGCHNFISKTDNCANVLVNVELFQHLYGKYVQMDDRFESVHIWSEELALKNGGRWTPIEITKEQYDNECGHSWNN